LTRLQTRRHGKGWDRKIWETSQEEDYVGWDTWRGWKEKDGLYWPWTGVRRGSIEEAGNYT